MTGCRARCTSLARSASMSSAWCADSSADRAGRNIATRARLPASRCTPGLRDSSRLPSPRFTPAIKKDDGHDVNISRLELRGLVGQSLADQLEVCVAAALRFRHRALRERGHLPRRHQVRVRLHQRQAHAHRRDLHSRLLALLGDIRVARGRARRLVRQAIRARLRRERSVGTRPIPAPRFPTRWCAGRPSATLKQHGASAASRSKGLSPNDLRGRGRRRAEAGGQ